MKRSLPAQLLSHKKKLPSVFDRGELLSGQSKLSMRRDCHTICRSVVANSLSKDESR